MAWDQELSSGLMLLTFMPYTSSSSASQLLSNIGTQAGCSHFRSSGLMTYTFVCCVVSLASASGIPKKFLVDPMRTWDQKFTPGLMLLTFMTVHLFQFRFADVVDDYQKYGKLEQVFVSLISCATSAGCSWRSEMLT